MLMTRIKIATVLLALVLLVLFVLPGWTWVVFASLLSGLGFWEWLRMTPTPYASPVGRILLALLFGNILAAIALVAPVFWMAWLTGISLLVASVFWLLLVPLWLVKRWELRKPVLHFLVGIVLLVPAWCALVSMKSVPPEPWLLLTTMAVPWIADIGAYFSGKQFGKRKLAPAISPGKTWEGVAGAAVCMLIYAVALNQIGGIFTALSLPVLLLLLVLSVTGDLFESLMKRQAGIKDSSQLLPGHGGVLDRIDSQLSVLPVALLMIIIAVGH
ncbi:MAG: Phosphatidate cytidylyltransferase [Fluviibacter phosphoraccumulans EoVTN8]